MALIGNMQYLTIGDKTYRIASSQLPIASASTLGGIKVGTGLTIDSTTGVLNATGTSITIDNALNGTSTNPVQNKVIKEALDDKADSADIPTKTSDLTNDSNFMSGMTILSYGTSTWNDFITAYQANHVVYCRASSNANPASGSQTRMAFMAYVSDATNPTNVEFQYYRSMSSHSASQQGDQVYVYKLTNGNSWTVTVREASVKITTGSSNGINATYSNGAVTIGHTNSVTAQSTQALYPITYDAQGHITGSGTAVTIPTTVSSFTNDAGYVTTDEKVKLTSNTGSTAIPIVLGPTSITSGTAYNCLYNTNLKYTPSTGNLQTTQLNGVTVGSTPKFTDTVTTVTSSGSGDVVTGMSASNGAITYTKGTINTGATCTVSATAPSSPQTGDMWFILS